MLVAVECRVADGVIDGQLQSTIVKMQRCTLNGCGKVC